MPVLNTCCFCCTTRTGTLILGILNLIGSVFGLLGCIIVLASWDGITKDWRKEAAAQGVNIEETITFLLVTFIIMMILCLFFIAVASMLIHGVREMRPGFMMPYLVVTVIGLVLGTILNIATLATGGSVLAGLMGLIVGNAIGIYFFLVIYSYYQELREGGGTAAVPPNSAKF